MATVNTLWEHLCGSAYFSCPLWRLRLKISRRQAHSLYSRCLGYALPMVLSTNFPCSQWALIPNERS